MKRIIALAAGLVIAAAPGALAGPGRDGAIRAVSVLPAARSVEVVIDLEGAAEVQDFTLANPARLVIDFDGARLAAPAVLYDGQNRGGVKNIRYAQFRPGVVRVVIDLDVLKDYQIERRAGQVRVKIGSERTTFAAWYSQAAAPPAASLSAVAPAPAAPATRGGAAALVTMPTPSDADVSIAEYLAAHAREGEQSQAPRITVTWDNADLREVVAGFAAFSGRTIILSKELKGTVSAEIKNQPWDLAFHAVLESQGLEGKVLEGGIIQVIDKKDLARADSTVPVETRLVRVNYARAGALVPAVKSILTKRGDVVADSTTNGLVLTEISSRIARAEEFVKGLDIRTPQVSIQAKIIFVDRTDVEELGLKYDLGSQTQFFNQLVQRPIQSTAAPSNPNINGVPTGTTPTQFYTPSEIVVDLGGNSLSALANANQQVVNPALSLIFSTAVGNFDLTTFLQALQRVDLADLQAEPSITTLDNRAAEILVGDRVPIRVIDVSAASTGGANVPRATVNFQQTGINLKVTPHITANRQILMEVHAENSSVKPASVDIGFTFQTQQADNQILVNDGETAVIGGLTVTSVTVSKSGIPFLVDLPILGKLFGFTSETEERRDLLILITPHIIDDLATPSAGK